MNRSRALCRRFCSLLLSILLLSTTAAVCVPASAEEGDGITVKLFQSTSHYDMGLDRHNVRLGWSITADYRGMYQSAYHIVVTDEEGSTAWDSGWVESNTQVGILVPDLKPETVYTARVQVRDQAGKESPFSEDFVFETAPDGLESEWLGSNRLLRTTFTLDQPLSNVKRARCYMSSSGIIEVRLNGDKVGDLIWNPKKSVADKVTYYNTFDVTSMLREGKNAVGAYTGNEAMGGCSLNGMLRIYYKDGSVQTVATGEGWKTSASSEITRANIAQGEDIDARKLTAWDTPDYKEDSTWSPAPIKSGLKSVNGEVTIPDNFGTITTFETFSGDYSIELTVTVNQTVSGFMFGVTSGESSPCMWQVSDGTVRIHYPGWTQIETPAIPVRNGTKTTMRLDIQGNTVTTYVDGQKIHTATVPAGETQGALGIRTALHEVATYDRLAVIQNGKVIWEDNFDSADPEKWTFPGIPTPKPAISGTTVIEEYKPVAVKEIQKNGKTSYVLDYGQNMQGFVRLDTKGTAGVSYRIEYSELVEDNGDIRPVTTAHCPTSTYTLSGGEDHFCPRFFYTGFRYIKVTSSDGSAIDPEAFTACFASDDLTQTGFFESSNERLNTVLKLYLMSQRSNLMGNYTDCPQREKNGWLGDASVIKEASAIMLGDYGVAEAFLETMLMDIKRDGRPEIVVPVVSTGESGAQYDITWASAYFVFPYELYMATGDTYYIERSYKDLLRVFEHAKTFDPDGDYIVTHNVYGDWLGYDNAEGKLNREFLSASYFWYCGHLLSEMMEVIGEDHSELDAYLEKVYDAIQKRFVRAGVYGGRVQTSNAMALDFGLVPEDGVADALSAIIKASENSGYTLRTGVLGTKSLYDSLSIANQHKLLMDMTLNPEKCSFGYLIDNGATTLWEFWDKAGETFHSHLEGQPVGFWDSQNHVMFGGGPAVWMFEGLGGITNSGAGYAQSTFRPGIESGLDYANTSIDAFVGKLTSNWKMENGDLHWSIEVPANTTATVRIPFAAAKSITESGRDIFMKDGDGITYVGQDMSGDFIYTVGGGSYTFVASETPLPETEPVESDPVDSAPEGTPAPSDTTASADTAPETKPAKKGCGSSLGLTAVAPLVAAPLLLAKKKKRRA